MNWLVRFYIRNDTKQKWIEVAPVTLPLILLLIVAALALHACGEPASTWSEKQSRYRPTDEVQREIINEEIDRREMERGR